MATPILKWAGGKRQLLDELYARFPASYDPGTNAYHEPFLGSGALFFDHEPRRGTVNDRNARLHNFYVQVRDRPDELIERCRALAPPERDPDPDGEFARTDRKGRSVDAYYYQQRALFNRRPNGEPFDDLAEAARLLYLNRTGFNGLYRENADGEFNVPIGRYADPDWVRAEQVREASRVLRRLPDDALRQGEYDYVADAVEPGDLVYFDPPYEPMSPTADFAEYSAGGFDREDQLALVDLAVDLAARGVHVVCSNSGVTYDTYADAGLFVDHVAATRAINSDADARGEVNEVIATSVPPDERRGTDQRSLSAFE
ncbi:Dam family site-specific DNA-(adenine-N6)-methyltransferase [Halorubrum sp. JWXQ-INN 858]|uniref:DNA adenine methylase n=1 Tax=Halorubrum sp. JWXQ-INN 858 TaxID=2690782 RepID=UPI001356D50D|nr:Dam family site-specific DNA-(adenine-N6)-methyltransferase [Halorubrum sp. JWXQ-INN 858]MWV65344.1 Dam family site-specific DNA-(adenine-N6)-methyltransferase [Halorubrum sp. JWXQ-INN 858]